MTFGEKLTGLRKREGLSQEALVEQLRKSPELANTLAALLVSAPSEK